MDHTGRIGALLRPDLRRLVFGTRLRRRSLGDLRAIATIDRAHIVMLAERGLIDPVRAARLLEAIEGLARVRFAPLHALEPGRGLYMLYEDYLVATEGSDVGGLLQTARSRNDLQATLLLLRLRRPYLRLLREALRLVLVLLSRARRDADVMMPLYTHGQVAVPDTLGHYYLGIAEAVIRDVEALLAVVSSLQTSALGAGAGGGTEFPIDTTRTAALLGFDRGPRHAIDAVASRDAALRLLASTALFSVTLSRLASDLWLWSTTNFGFLHYADDLVGASSAMPQKRNPFLLEHVLGRSAAPLGALTTALTSMHGQPFTNSIAVGTEGVAPVWHALRSATDAARLLRAMVEGAMPDRTAMARCAEDGGAGATALANRIVRGGGLDFRTAHRLVGAAVTAAAASGRPVHEILERYLSERGAGHTSLTLDLGQVARERDFGGGPGPNAARECECQVQRAWSAARTRVGKLAAHWRASASALDDAVRQFKASVLLSAETTHV